LAPQSFCLVLDTEITAPAGVESGFFQSQTATKLPEDLASTKQVSGTMDLQTGTQLYWVLSEVCRKTCHSISQE
jgi:hypothetical protein